GLYLATENGYDINRDVITMGYSAMKSLNKENPDPFLQYVTVLFSRKLRDPIGSIVDYKEDVASIVLTALSYETLNMSEKASALVEEAMEYVNLNADDAILGDSFSYFFDDTVVLSLLLKASVDLKMPSTTIAEISKRLLKMGNGSYWYRTSSTAMAVLSLSSVSNVLSEEAEVKVLSEKGEVIFEGDVSDSITIPFAGKNILVESTDMVVVSTNGETTVGTEVLEAENTGLTIERVLRRKLAVPMDDTHVLTTPQIDSPYVVSSIKTLSPDEVGSLEISVSKSIEGMKLAITEGELKLGEYGLGLRIYEGDVLGISNGEIIIRTLEYGYYDAATAEIHSVKLGIPEPISVGETIISEIHIVIPDDVPYVVLEDMLPSTGISVEENLEADILGYTKFYYYDYYWWGYTFKDARFDRISFFFRDGGEFVTKSNWRILTKGEFIIPAVQAWAMYDGDVRANTESVKLIVE
ncbi:MAG: alpha-2-macroglobulin domain protein, partial [Thermotogaceae bacterium]|nr:alpha-2-macroglobulin domain protein [Thermotogaceae bacterium]